MQERCGRTSSPWSGGVRRRCGGAAACALRGAEVDAPALKPTLHSGSSGGSTRAVVVSSALPQTVSRVLLLVLRWRGTVGVYCVLLTAALMMSVSHATTTTTAHPPVPCSISTPQAAGSRAAAQGSAAACSRAGKAVGADLMNGGRRFLLVFSSEALILFVAFCSMCTLLAYRETLPCGGGGGGSIE